MPDVIYLDNAATSWPKPPQVGEAIARFLANDAANPGRGGHRMALAAQRVVDEARLHVARLLNAPHERVAILNGATDALNAAIHGVLTHAFEHPRNGAKPHAVTTVIEHNGVMRPLRELQRRGWIDLDLVGVNAEGVVDPDDVIRATNERTALVCVMHASNVTGALQPVEEIGNRLRVHRPDALLLVDAAQTAGLMPIDVSTAPFDLVAFPGHKSLLGPTGIGALYVGPRAYIPDNDDHGMTTYRQGGTGGDSGNPLMPSALPRVFEPGTPNTVGCAGLVAAMDAAPPAHVTLEHERRLAAAVLDAVSEIDGSRILGPRASDKRMGVATFTLPNLTPRDVGAVLDATFNIAVRPGLHCAPGAHAAFGTAPGGAIRVSPGPFTTDEDVRACIEALRVIVRSS